MLMNSAEDDTHESRTWHFQAHAPLRFLLSKLDVEPEKHCFLADCRRVLTTNATGYALAIDPGRIEFLVYYDVLPWHEETAIVPTGVALQDSIHPCTAVVDKVAFFINGDGDLQLNVVTCSHFQQGDEVVNKSVKWVIVFDLKTFASDVLAQTAKQVAELADKLTSIAYRM